MEDKWDVPSAELINRPVTPPPARSWSDSLAGFGESGLGLAAMLIKKIQLGAE